MNNIGLMLCWLVGYACARHRAMLQRPAIDEADALVVAFQKRFT